jgi:hypothetical protein
MGTARARAGGQFGREVLAQADCPPWTFSDSRSLQRMCHRSAPRKSNSHRASKTATAPGLASPGEAVAGCPRARPLCPCPLPLPLPLPVCGVV